MAGANLYCPVRRGAVGHERGCSRDLLFVSKKQAYIVTEDNVQGPPDLVVEILSPSTAERDRTFKRALYARYGVREYWLVDPDTRTVTVLLLDDGAFVEVAHYGAGQTLTSHADRLHRQPG